ncbi:MAG: threonylcarbamoyl-AMP synthase [Rhodobiaceae bacterium]|nr:threonylcarbamoyl-AMP synthase [Rhodobiaceae bacterium]
MTSRNIQDGAGETARVVPADEKGIAEAARVLRAGGLVAFATETVYGLGADATDGAAVARIFEVKGRPSFNPLIVHVNGLEQARKLGRFNADAEKLAGAFWPGPLTIVVPMIEPSPLSSLVSAGLGTVAIRAPRSGTAQALLAAAGVPVAAPSANSSGRLSPTRAGHVAKDLGGAVDLILDGGPTEVGIESTIVACAGDRAVLLRAGGITAAEIEIVLGARLAAAQPGKVSAPGQLASHYAPGAPLRLDAHEVRAGEALLGFGPQDPVGAGQAVAALNLSRAADLREAAANLFEYLHRLDAMRPAAIAVAPIPREGLGEAINDRLARGAAPRETS